MQTSLLYDSTPAASTLSLAAEFLQVRSATRQLIASLQPEDTVAQSMPDASPAKWHLGHTSWFFEQFILTTDDSFRQKIAQSGRHPRWMEMFNSYYESAGPRFARPQRGLLTRPTLEDVLDYRALIDEEMINLIAQDDIEKLNDVVTLGLHHERQHQELLLTDIKHLFSLNPLQPAYLVAKPDTAGKERLASRATPVEMRFLEGRSGIVAIGHSGTGFSFDNESPRHRVFLEAHRIANRPVNNSEYREFIEAGGYQEPRLWMSAGWDTVQREAWNRPLYWAEGLDSVFTLQGPQPMDPLAPVCHISYFEADAFARWAQARLPTEAEWETLSAAEAPDAGNFLESGLLRPLPPGARGSDSDPLQLFGDVWEWTSSPYINYPGFKPMSGGLGEYNGKFMCGQWVLRGGSCVTPAAQMRATYRNFFQSADRWQFSGLRLARDV